MPRPCRCCAHPQRAAIDKALASGTASYRNLAERYGTSPAALARHRAHAGAALVLAAERRELNIGGGIVDGLAGIRARLETLLVKMEGEGDFRGAVLACREIRETLAALDATLARAAAPAKGSEPGLRVSIEYLGGERCPRCGGATDKC